MQDIPTTLVTSANPGRMASNVATVYETPSEKEKEARTKARARLDCAGGLPSKFNPGCVLEDNPLFNAGKGSVFTTEGTHEMDASSMEGHELEAGAVSAISGVKNPLFSCCTSRKAASIADCFWSFGNLVNQ